MKQGDCFANANVASRLYPGSTVVHGTVICLTKSGSKKRGPHAWIEQNNVVIDPTLGIVEDKKDYYTLTKAKPEVEYSEEQSTVAMIRHGHHGPWHK